MKIWCSFIFLQFATCTYNYPVDDYVKREDCKITRTGSCDAFKGIGDMPQQANLSEFAIRQRGKN